jgi:L-cysteine S-thiosulfotransferase
MEMRKYVVTAMVAALAVSSAQAISKKEQKEINKLVKQTEQEIAKAKKAGHLWRDTEKMFTRGQQAVKKNEVKSGKALIQQALAQAKAAQKQAKDQANAGPHGPLAPEMINEGKKLAFDRKKGNCLACHVIPGGDMAGTIAPPLVAMKTRYPDKTKLRAQIWDATSRNSKSIMPPFGKHGILSEEEINKVVEYIHTL